MGNFVSTLTGNNDETKKIKYKVTIKTGDKKFAGTSSSVGIILHGEGLSSEICWADNFLRNDFEKGKADDFTIKAIKLNKVEFIEIIRGFSLFDQWFVEEVSVADAERGEVFVFPVHRWIKPRGSIKIQHLDTVLPQFDRFPEQRKAELDSKKTQYQLEIKRDGNPPQSKHVPSDEDFSFGQKWDLTYLLASTKITAEKKKRFIPGDKWESFEHIMEAYVDGVFPVPEGTKDWRDDKHFGRQRLVGGNSNIISLCEQIPDKFPVTDEMVQSSLEGITLQEAIEQKKLFIVDYESMTGLPTKPGFTVCDPIALFFVNGENDLIPIAIQLKQKPADDNPIFLPSDPEYTWMLAKMWFNNSDGIYHQSVQHLGCTHIVTEGFCTTTHRHLSPSHPIFKLLAPHFLYLLKINGIALASLVGPGQWVDRTMNMGRLGLSELIKRRFQTWRLDVDGNFTEDLSRRGVLSSDVLPKYHFRDDALKVHEAIKDYVTEYVSVYYDTEEKLTGDWELQRWAEELQFPVEQGGVGVKGLPMGENNKIDSNDQLIVIMTFLIYTSSVTHAIVNFLQYDEFGYPPNYPAHIKGKPPKDKTPLTEQDVLNALPDQNVTLNIMVATKLLSENSTNSLGNFETMFIHDPKGLNCVNKFREKLEQISDSIQEANKTRDPPYLWMDPKNIPNSISI